MGSPIAELLNAIAASPFRIAPEAAADLDGVIAAKALSLEVSDDSRLFAELLPSNGIIRLGVPFLEVLWSAAHTYIVTFHEYQQANQRRETIFEIGGASRTATAYKLYRDLLHAHAAGSPIQWPSQEIIPARFPQEGTDTYVANELFLVAISWIIHHEIAHARLGHQEVTVTSMLQENEADRAATKWICEGTQEKQPLQKRSMGIVTAVMLLLAYDIEVGRTHSTSHPPSFERLILNLDATGAGEDEMVYAFAFVLVEMHLVQAKVPYKSDQDGTFRDMCVSTCLALRNVVASGA
jgi:hypothetical protein